jgi:hypothetical protein
MSFDFVARFDTTRLPLPEILARLDTVLTANDIRPVAVSSVASHEGTPTVDVVRRASIDVTDLASVPAEVHNWWGINVYCVSDRIAEELGRSTSMEVDFVIFPTPNREHTLTYRESSRVCRMRSKDTDAANQLVELQLGLCTALDLKLSAYDEESSDLEQTPLLTLDIFERWLAKSVERGGAISALCSLVLMSQARASEVAGRRRDDVRMSSSGYFLFPFLSAT